MIDVFGRLLHVVAPDGKKRYALASEISDLVFT